MRSTRMEQESPNDDANMMSDGNKDDEHSFVQPATKKAVKRGSGFDDVARPICSTRTMKTKCVLGRPSDPSR